MEEEVQRSSLWYFSPSMLCSERQRHIVCVDESVDDTSLNVVQTNDVITYLIHVVNASHHMLCLQKYVSCLVSVKEMLVVYSVSMAVFGSCRAFDH